jgi:hypothetical protein
MPGPTEEERIASDPNGRLLRRSVALKPLSNYITHAATGSLARQDIRPLSLLCRWRKALPIEIFEESLAVGGDGELWNANLKTGNLARLLGEFRMSLYRIPAPWQQVIRAARPFADVKETAMI